MSSLDSVLKNEKRIYKYSGKEKNEKESGKYRLDSPLKDTKFLPPQEGADFLRLLHQWRLWLGECLYNQHKTTLSLAEIEKITQCILDRLIMIKYMGDYSMLKNVDKLMYFLFQSKETNSVAENLQKLFSEFEKVYESPSVQRDEVEKILHSVDERVLKRIVHQLANIDFTVLTSDILGIAYEDYLGHHIAEKDGNLILIPDHTPKRGRGVYYTPLPVVEYIVEKTVNALLKSRSDSTIHSHTHDADSLSEFRVLDPACGCGIFLKKALEEIREHYRKKGDGKRKSKENVKEIERCEEKKNNPPAAPMPKSIGEHLYGVDADKRASEIAFLSLGSALSSSTESSFLQQNIKVGDALLSWLDLDADINVNDIEKIDCITALRQRMNLNNGQEELKKQLITLKKELNSYYNQKLVDVYFPGSNHDDVAAFNWQIEFPEVFSCQSSERGFDVVLGNPPWVSYGLRGVKRIPEQLQTYYREKISCAAEYKISMYALFMGRGISLLKSHGLLGFVLPDSFLVGRYFSRIRRFILDKAKIREIILIHEDFWPHQTVGHSVILLLEREPSREKRRENIMAIKYSETLEDLQNRNFKTCYYSQGYFETTSRNKFILFFDKESRELVDKVRKSSSRLGQFVDLYSGCIGRYGQKSIVSDEKREEFVVRNGTKIIYHDQHAVHKWEPLLESGSAIGRYSIAFNSKYVYVEPDEDKRSVYAKSGFDVSMYTGEKLFLRQTGDSLVAAYDAEDYFCLNNMHVLKTKRGTQEDIKYVVALLNSRLINYFYHLVSLEQGRALSQIDIDTVEELPIRRIDCENKRSLHDQIVEKVEIMLLLHRQLSFLVDSFRTLVKRFGQDNAGYRSLADYASMSPCESEVYGIDLVNYEQCLDRRKRRVVTSVEVKESKDSLIISGLLSGQREYKNMLRIRFKDELFKRFFLLAINLCINENSKRKKWSKKKIVEVLDNVCIPCHVLAHEKDAANIKYLMETLEEKFEKALETKFLHSPLRAADLWKIQLKISEIDGEIDNLVYCMYNLNEREIKLVEKGC